MRTTWKPDQPSEVTATNRLEELKDEIFLLESDIRLDTQSLENKKEELYNLTN